MALALQTGVEREIFPAVLTERTFDVIIYMGEPTTPRASQDALRTTVGLFLPRGGDRMEPLEPARNYEEQIDRLIQ